MVLPWIHDPPLPKYEELDRGPTDDRIFDRDGAGRLGWDNLDEGLQYHINLVWVGDGLVTNLIQGIRNSRDDLTQENFFDEKEGVMIKLGAGIPMHESSIRMVLIALSGIFWTEKLPQPPS